MSLIESGPTGGWVEPRVTAVDEFGQSGARFSAAIDEGNADLQGREFGTIVHDHRNMVAPPHSGA